MKVYFVEKRYANGIWKEVDQSPFRELYPARRFCDQYKGTGETFRIIEGEQCSYPSSSDWTE